VEVAALTGIFVGARERLLPGLGYPFAIGS
jgi:hypothetical protein